MKVAEGRSLGDPETIHFGLIPRSHRGIVAINELPDLAERIQVSMLNVMEERDVQIRGYVLRLPLDVLVVASANPEDYTNRGRIITPLKDRFGAEIRTHYPTELEAEVAVVRQEAHLVAEVPDYLVEILARFTRNLRESSSVDQRSGVSARFAIAGAETIAAAALHRATVQGEAEAVARVVDLETAVDVLGGKIEFETGEEGREQEILTHLLRTATAETVRAHFRGLDFGLLVEAIEDGRAGHHRRAGHRPRLPRRAAGARRVGALRRRVRPPRRRPTTASAPAPSSSRWRASTSPARSARTPTERDRLWLVPLQNPRFPGIPHFRRCNPRSAIPGSRDPERAMSRQRTRFRRYDGGDPLAPPVDIAEALDAIGEDVMAGYSPERAMREFLRRGGRSQTGLDDLARRVAERRRDLLQRHNLDGTLEEVRELLDRAVLEERKQLARDAMMDDADRAFREMQLDNLPPSTAAAVSELSDYDWASRAGARGLRADQGPARPRAAGPALRGHEAGAGERHRRGPRSDQRDARRPQRAAGEAPARRGHRRGLRASSWTSTATSSRRTRRTSTSCSTPSPSAPQPPSGCSTR